MEESSAQPALAQRLHRVVSGAEEIQIGEEYPWLGTRGQAIGRVRMLLQGDQVVGRVVYPDTRHVQLRSFWNPQIHDPDFPQWQDPPAPLNFDQAARLRSSGFKAEQWIPMLRDKSNRPLVLVSNGFQPDFYEPWGFMVVNGSVVRPNYAWERYPLDAVSLAGKGYDSALSVFILEPGPPRVAALRFKGEIPIEELPGSALRNEQSGGIQNPVLNHVLSGIPMLLHGKNISGQVRNNRVPELREVRPNEFSWDTRRKAAFSALGTKDGGPPILLTVTAHIQLGDVAELMRQAGMTDGILLQGSGGVYQWLADENYPPLVGKADTGSERAGEQPGRAFNAVLAGYEISFAGLEQIARPEVPSQRRALLIGMGNIGRGYLAPLLAQDDFDLAFADISPELIAAANAQESYTVTPVGAGEPITVKNFRGVSIREEEKVAALGPAADWIFTSVGVKNLPRLKSAIHLFIKKRLEAGHREMLNIVFAENLPVDQPEIAALRTAVLELATQDTDLQEYIRTGVNFIGSGSVYTDLAGYLDYVDNNVGWAGAVVHITVPPTIAQSAKNPLDISVEGGGPYYLEVDANELRDTGFIPRGIRPVKNIRAAREKKLLVHNMGHATLAYLAAALGIEDPAEAMKDPRVGILVRKAMWEAARGIHYRNPTLFPLDGLQEYIDELAQRFANVELRDTVQRIGQDPMRKLAVNDRLFGAAAVAQEAGVSPDAISLAIAAAIFYARTVAKISEEDLAPVFAQAESMRLQIPRDERAFQEQLHLLAGLEEPVSTHGSEGVEKTISAANRLYDVADIFQMYFKDGHKGPFPPQDWSDFLNDVKRRDPEIHEALKELPVPEGVWIQGDYLEYVPTKSGFLIVAPRAGEGKSLLGLTLVSSPDRGWKGPVLNGEWEYLVNDTVQVLKFGDILLGGLPPGIEPGPLWTKFPIENAQRRSSSGIEYDAGVIEHRRLVPLRGLISTGRTPIASSQDRNPLWIFGEINRHQSIPYWSGDLKTQLGRLPYFHNPPSSDYRLNINPFGGSKELVTQWAQKISAAGLEEDTGALIMEILDDPGNSNAYWHLQAAEKIRLRLVEPFATGLERLAPALRPPESDDSGARLTHLKERRDIQKDAVQRLTEVAQFAKELFVQAQSRKIRLTSYPAVSAVLARWTVALRVYPLLGGVAAAGASRYRAELESQMPGSALAQGEREAEIAGVISEMEGIAQELGKTLETLSQALGLLDAGLEELTLPTLLAESADVEESAVAAQDEFDKLLDAAAVLPGQL